MKCSILFCFALGISLNVSYAAAKVDTAYCDEFLHLAQPTLWQLNENGKPVALANDINSEHKGDTYKFWRGGTIATDGARSLETATIKTENGYPSQVQEDFTFNAANSDVHINRSTVTTLTTMNGKCVPSSETQTLNGEQSKNWDLHLCKDVGDYLKAHPAALQCSCGNEQTNNDLSKILQKYGVSTNPRPDSNPSDGDVSYQALKRLSAPVGIAYEKTTPCISNSALAKALGDPNVWKTPAASPTSGGSSRH